ncbi:Similar to unc-13: Phorbol ester/diacylglycerol-binding protein unc-13 (Caenorhabditis elegans) [Cotesia congregata]|uniref:Similar to unc-13: Phorbol ester/diacylglycerol-binding protein unc-13 (Caenorhabditis elegans) n=1 Tax=Cotesia congregata TaxID=51543 RepID=A0A8J2H827_COTCN|nr:Similar to unc-13: Phorbol ester/diacylglycerol-binding protein unc-13 (Caenorhabditis elegans) [Cotesia congregata]
MTKRARVNENWVKGHWRLFDSELKGVVRRFSPCYFTETNDVNTGLLVEVWSKGMLWDRALGYHYIPLPEVSYANENFTSV